MFVKEEVHDVKQVYERCDDFIVEYAFDADFRPPLCDSFSMTDRSSGLALYAYVPYSLLFSVLDFSIPGAITKYAQKILNEIIDFLK